MNDEITKDWELYEAGIKYNNSLLGADRNYYNVLDTNIAFVAGDQWRGAEGENLPKPVFNIIKRIIQFKIASLTSNNVSISLEPMEYRPTDNDETMQSSIHSCDLARAEIDSVLNKVKFKHRVRDLCQDGATTGDMCLHWFFNVKRQPFKYNERYRDILGAIDCEIIDSTNIIFGNPNSIDVENQPYIIIVGRDFVRNLKMEYAKENKHKDMINEITDDSDTQYQAGDNSKIESSADKYGKALYIIKYFRGKDGKIYANKSVKNIFIYKSKALDLDYYPISFTNWEKTKGSYHGRADVTGLIPNQIAINKMFAMIIYHLMLTAFPTAVYDASKIEEWSNEIGSAIAVTRLTPGESIKNIAGYLEPSNMSSNIINAVELTMQFTKECMGVGDAALGNVDPKNTSAIIAVQRSNVIPLENVRDNLYEFVEDCGRIIIDIMASKYGVRPVVITDGDNRLIEEFDFGKLKGLWVNIKAEVGASSYWSEIASIQTLDNLLNAGRLEFIDYLERIPSEVLPKKAELIQRLKQGDPTKNALYNLMGKFMQGLPPELQQQLQAMKPEDMEKEILKMMGVEGE